jgi:hypothetical protein
MQVEEAGGEPAAPRAELFAPAVKHALSEGLAHPVGGEVVVRSGDVIGRIYLFKGAIAWVNCSSLAVRVRDTLLAHSDIRAEELEAAIEEAQRTRKHFAETLLAWGLIEREWLWECLRIHNAQHLRAVAQLQEQPQVLFVPLVRTYSADLVFTPEQLLGESWVQGREVTQLREVPLASPLHEAPSAPQPLAVLPAAVSCVLEQAGVGHALASERLEQQLPPGVLAAMLVDTEARHICGSFSRLEALAPGQEDISRWLLELTHGRVPAEQGDAGQPRELLWIAEDTIHVISRCPVRPSLFLWVMADSAITVGHTLAHCRMAIKSLGQEPA